MEDFHLILGCFGLTIDNFTCCCGIENIILKGNPSIHNYNEMVDYFDRLKLFNQPIFDLNAIRHIIFNIQDRFTLITKPIWSVKSFELYQKFVIDHKRCGLLLKTQIPLIVENPKVKVIEPVEQKVVFAAVNKVVKEDLKKKQCLIRGRR
jgi:hypothetical protein